MRIELDEYVLSKIISKLLKRNLKVKINDNHISIQGSFLIIIPFTIKLVPIKTTGSIITFSVEGLASYFLPDISEKGITLKDNILSIYLSEYIEGIQVKKFIISKGKLYLEV
ncbi:MAG: hypothetical protein RMJ38_03495 [candidate division WOR-3 bacterium]|nr:hypothetical protein [candidate division WOR-3 bacterium]MDW8150486.1 hypothetical protein [candidate division WOR-3 bacterium]